MRINEVKFNPTKIAALILLVIAWSKGTVTGIEAWILLLLIADIEFTWKL